MPIPSYDDLTPPIDDVSPAGMFDVARVLPIAAASPPSAINHLNPQSTVHNPQLFACLRSTRAPQALLPLAADFSPRVQRRGASAVVLEVSGLGRLLGDATAIGAELHRAARERSPHIAVAVAPTQAAALLLGHAPLATLAVVSGSVAAALAPLPLAVLRAVVTDAFAAGDAHVRAFDVLRLWGLTTIGEFVALPPVELSERIGQAGVALQAMARGVDPAPLVPDPGVPRFDETIELEWPIEQLEPLAFVLPRLLDPLSAALERADRGAAAIRVDLRLADRTTHRRVLQLPAAMRDPRVLRMLVLLDLESHPPAAGIDVVTIEVDPAPARIVQYSLLERARPSAETVATLTARLHALVGEARCGTPLLLDTHRPDGFELRRFTGEKTGTGNVVPRDHVDTVEGPCFLRRFRPPVAIRVAVAHGRPVSIAIDRRGMPGGRVERAAGPWRTSGGWWDGGVHWDRDEWDVAVADGTACRIFRDRASGQWFLEGIVD